MAARVNPQAWPPPPAERVAAVRSPTAAMPALPTVRQAPAPPRAETVEQPAARAAGQPALPAAPRSQSLAPV